MAEVVGGYGFLAVFVSALVLRDYERSHEYHGVLHGFLEHIERLLTLALLLLLGHACATGLATFPGDGELWSTVAFTVLVSVVVHGITAAPVVNRLDDSRV